MENIFNSILNETTLNINLYTTLSLIFSSLLVGIIISFLYNIRSNSSKNFLNTLAIMPSIVALLIVMVNGNVGTGVAVAGAFSLVKFRSVPGTSREIGAIFLAMASGIALGMGYVMFAILFTVIISLFYLMLDFSKFGESNKLKRNLTINIPEDLNYVNVFENIFEKYTINHKLISTKTTNMGSMFKLKYEIIIKEGTNEKEFIDQLRIVNGNLDILLTNGGLIQNEL